MSTLTEAYANILTVEGREELETKIRDAILESCSLLPSSRNDTRNCAVVLCDDGGIDTRMMGQNESFRNATVLHVSRHWVAWEMIPDNRQAIGDSEAAQSDIISAAIEQAKADEDEEAIPALDNWQSAYKYLDTIPDDVREILAIEYRDWFAAEESGSYIDNAIDDAVQTILREMESEQNDDE